MRIGILISTIDNGIEKIPAMLMPQRGDLFYIISHQYTDDSLKTIPVALVQRADVTVSQIAGRGVAKSRNNALEQCPAGTDIALFADDDGKYKSEYIDNLKALAAANPHTDLFCLEIETNEGEQEYNSNYFSTERQITDTYQLSVATPELAVRPDRVKSKGVWFDSRFGAGAGFIQFADENLFIHDCLRAGLSVWFYPQYVVNIPYENTIKKMPKYDSRKVRALGALDIRTKGRLRAYAKAFWFSIRYIPSLIREKHSPLRYLSDRLSGIRYISKTKRPADDIR